MFPLFIDTEDWLIQKEITIINVLCTTTCDNKISFNKRNDGDVLQ